MKKENACPRVLFQSLILIAVAAMIAGGSVPVRAQSESFKTLFPFFVELKGWKAEKPDGASISMGAMSMTNATREYTLGDQSITAMIIKGQQAMAMMQPGMTVETTEGKITTRTIDGFLVHIAFDKEDRSGNITVLMDNQEKQAAFFTLTFENMSVDKALEWTKKFDWKAIKKKLASMP
jgi:hypothetical protein